MIRLRGVDMAGYPRTNRAPAGLVIREVAADTLATEAEIIEAVQADREAFALLYRRHVSQVYRYCYCRLGNREAAEDATSAVFTKALIALPRYRGGSFRAWLFAIAQNVVVDDYRSRRPVQPLAAAADLVDPAVPVAPGHHRAGPAPSPQSLPHPGRSG